MNAFEPGCDSGSPPDNLTRIDVTDDGGDHLSYLDSDAVMNDLADNFGDGENDDGGDDDDNWVDWF